MFLYWCCPPLLYGSSVTDDNKDKQSYYFKHIDTSYWTLRSSYCVDCCSWGHTWDTSTNTSTRPPPSIWTTPTPRPCTWRPAWSSWTAPSRWSSGRSDAPQPAPLCPSSPLSLSLSLCFFVSLSLFVTLCFSDCFFFSLSTSVYHYLSSIFLSVLLPPSFSVSFKCPNDTTFPRKWKVNKQNQVWKKIKMFNQFEFLWWGYNQTLWKVLGHKKENNKCT